ncbi:MAG TPA: hypothetical protein VMX14_03840 [Anaerolineae bacterium]|nr:hypothetical protein [Anaerolineae bacterium]HUW08150.1 hypothetical protein [Anaerolineae bacterium]
MPVIWQIRLKQADGSLAAIVDDYESFSAEKRVNAPALYSLRMSGENVKVALFELDGQLEFWRRWPEQSINWTKEIEAFHRNADYIINADGSFTFQSQGRGYVDLLNRRIIANFTASSEASKANVAETVAKEFVLEQVGADAGVGRVTTGLSIELDGANGNPVYLARFSKNVLEVLQEIGRIGGGDFDVVGTGEATFEFRWYDGQLGTDRSATVIFSLPLGNMARPVLSVHRSTEKNAIWVGGQGQQTSRVLVWRIDAGTIDDSTWNRHELFTDARNTPSVDGLNSKGDALLDEHEARPVLTFDLLQVPACLYGKHYYLGDLVTALFEAGSISLSATRKITGVRFTVDAQRGEVLTVETSDV